MVSWLKILFACTLLCASALAEPRVKNPFLYTLEKNGKTSYLLGTIHNGVSLADFPGYVITAVQSSNSFICEIAQTFACLTQKDTHHVLFSTDGPGLRSSLSPQAWERLAKELLPTTNNLEAIDRLRPGAAVILLISNDQAASEDPRHLDHELRKYAGSRIQGLETLLDQALSFNTTQLEDFLNSTDNESGENTLEKIIEIYLSGETARLSEDFVDTQRNLLWMPKIENIHASTGQHFFFVGASHLPGEKGILNLAQAQGFEVLRMNKPGCDAAIAEDLPK